MDFEDSPEDAAFRAEARAWLQNNAKPRSGPNDWSRNSEHPDYIENCKRWQHTLYEGGWAALTWPVEYGGRGLSGWLQTIFNQEAAAYDVSTGAFAVGIGMCGPTLIAHGTEEQKQRYLPALIRGEEVWCQLFSEPEAGSDLAGLKTRAVKDGEEFVVNGQKVWTSSGQIADVGMLLARTNTDVPKHKGITYFAFDMHQVGVDVRPLRELTGRALFSEVFLTDVTARVEDVIGGMENGWAVANTTLAFERAGLGAGSAGAAESAAVPGTIVGHLDKRAGDFVRVRRSAATFAVGSQLMMDVARRHGRHTDPVVRQQIAKLHTEAEIGRYMTLRYKDLLSAGRDLPGMGNLAKLRMSEMFRQARELGMSLLGARGMIHDYGDTEAADDEDAQDRAVTDLALWSPGPSIYGGTDQVQRNILGERVLGLPREPGDERTTPFKDLRKNA